MTRRSGWRFGALALVLPLVSSWVATAEETQCTGAMTGEHQNVTVPEDAMCDMEGATVSGNVTVEDGAMLDVRNSTIAGNVDVRDDAGFMFPMDEGESSVGGNVEIGENSVLAVMDEVAFGGNLSANRAMAIMLFHLSVEGNVSFIGTGASMPNESSMNAICNETEIGGNTEILDSAENASWAIGSEPPCGGNGEPGNSFGGMLLLQGNEGELDIDDNSVARNLQIFRNSGGVDVSGNEVEGRLQCSDNDPPPTGGGNTAERKEGQCEAL